MFLVAWASARTDSRTSAASATASVKVVILVS
jgi:hypothetical protein